MSEAGSLEAASSAGTGWVSVPLHVRVAWTSQVDSSRTAHIGPTSMVKSMALMMPSSKVSWITSLSGRP
jgi:hypothetical protein